MNFNIKSVLLSIVFALAAAGIAIADPLPLGCPNISAAAQVGTEFYLSDANSFRYILRVDGPTAKFVSITDRTILGVANDLDSEQTALLVAYVGSNDITTHFVLELRNNGKESQLHIPPAIGSLISQSSPPSLFIDGGKVIIVFKHNYAAYDHGEWSQYSLGAVPGNLKCPKEMDWRKGKLFVCRYGGEWGEELFEFNSRNHQWKKLFDNLADAHPFHYSILDSHTLLVKNGQLFELSADGRLVRYVNAPPNLEQICVGQDKTVICVSDSGRIFCLEQLEAKKQMGIGKFREVSAAPNRSIRVLGVCSDYALVNLETGFSVLDLKTGKYLSPAGPV